MNTGSHAGSVATPPVTSMFRAEAVRPIVLALAFTVLGEVGICAVWGLWLFPEGATLGKLAWTLTCGVGMGATIGAFAVLLIPGRLSGWKAVVTAACISMLVLGHCTFLCYYTDLAVGWFGAQEAPVLFVIWGGLVPAIFKKHSFAGPWQELASSQHRLASVRGLSLGAPSEMGRSSDTQSMGMP